MIISVHLISSDAIMLMERPQMTMDHKDVCALFVFESSL